MLIDLTIQQLLEEDGVLSHQIDHFQCRPEQITMATAIEEAFDHHEQLIIEAGTGTGKTFAYLAPVFLSDNKVMISTGTKNLQDQLFLKDIPILKKALKSKKVVALLKGRSNYLCLYRLNRHLSEGRFYSPDTVRDLHRVQEWSHSTKTGDIAELEMISEDSSVWPFVTSNTDNCIGQECPHYSKCHVLKARRAAQNADILIVNHALLMADLMIKEEGFGELLPDTSALIFDEAHQLPQVATNFFGSSIGSKQMNDLAQDMLHEFMSTVKDDRRVKVAAERLQHVLLDIRLALSATKYRGSWLEIERNEQANQALLRLQQELSDAETLLSSIASRSRGLENCWKRAVEFKNQLKNLFDSNQSNEIKWFETYTKHFSLNATPMVIAEAFMSAMQQYDCPWIFTSATLTINRRFKFFQKNLGLQEAKTLLLDSPFDYQKQTLLYLPQSLPNPNDPNYTSSIVKAMLPVLKASQGRAFFLFTSFKALYEAEKILQNQIEYPLLIQGSQPKDILLRSFRQLGNAILLGTNSFWEGVDVKGEALSCVIIDKLPFESPGDPILKARITNIKQQGLEPFNEYQLPRAIINLKQGIGRLIRDQADRGVVVLCDPRIQSRSYGRYFINSLPPMSQTRELSDVEEFFAKGYTAPHEDSSH